MSVDWVQVAGNATEAAALHSLLDDYFESRGRHGTSAPPPRTLPTRIPPAPAPAPAPARADTLGTAAGTSIANAALKNTTVTNAALRNAGLNPAAASTAANFSAKHSHALAPHLANAASAGWANRGVLAGATGTPPPRPGIRKELSAPSGLVTAKGGIGKTLWNSKGPMSKEEARKNVFKEPLAVRQPRLYSPPVTSHEPPPTWGASAAEDADADAIGKAEAIYDYAGTEPDDLMVQEGEVVAVLEHVSADWWKCRGAQGEGLVPAAFLKAL